jgi:hypothetical protein
MRFGTASLGRLPAGLVLLLSLGARPARVAALQWDQTSEETTAAPGQRVVNFKFHFQNTGGRTVALVSIEPSCRCVSVVPSKSTFAPGEKGVVEADFTVAGKGGPREESLTVTTGEPGGRPIELILRVNIQGVSTGAPAAP